MFFPRPCGDTHGEGRHGNYKKETMNMKKYIKPVTEIVRTRYEGLLLLASKKPGVETDKEVIDDFDDDDESYSKPLNVDLWKDDDDNGGF